MAERVARLGLYIETDSEADAEELAELAVDLREQLLELDIESADPTTAGPVPPGTRAGEIFVAGALTVMLALSKQLLTALTGTVQSWVSLSGGRSVRLEIDGDVLEVTGITQREQRELINAWIDRRTPRVLPLPAEFEQVLEEQKLGARQALPPLLLARLRQDDPDLGIRDDLDEVITASRDAVAATPADQPDRPILLSNLGVALLVRFGRTGQLADLDEAITALGVGVAVTPPDHPNRPGRSSDLGTALEWRQERLRVPRPAGTSLGNVAWLRCLRRSTWRAFADGVGDVFDFAGITSVSRRGSRPSAWEHLEQRRKVHRSSLPERCL